jgi:hypothetical protein
MGGGLIAGAVSPRDMENFPRAKGKNGYNASHKLVFCSDNLQYEGWFSKCALKGFTVSKSARNMKDMMHQSFDMILQLAPCLSPRIDWATACRSAANELGYIAIAQELQVLNS